MLSLHHVMVLRLWKMFVIMFLLSEIIILLWNVTVLHILYTYIANYLYD